MHIPTTGVKALLLLLLVQSCSSAPDPANTADAPIQAPTVTVPQGVQPIPDAATALVSDPNPEHGQPGHRCEIPVGASLSTAPAAGTVNTTSTTPMISTPPAAPTPTDGSARLNPAHGEPGHDCNVAVGAPLP